MPGLSSLLAKNRANARSPKTGLVSQRSATPARLKNGRCSSQFALAGIGFPLNPSLFATMEKSKKLDWCIARLGEDGNWWLEETSNDIHWDMDGTGIIDPKQISFINDLMEPLREYGLENEIVDSAFFTFRIEDALPDNKVKLVRTKQSLTESTEALFALSDVIDDDKSPYAEMIDHLLELRVALINDQLDLTQKLEVEELEEDIRETQNNDYFVGKGSHYFNEITAILEYLPAGFELDSDLDAVDDEEDEEGLNEVLSDIDDAPEEDTDGIEKDESLRWDEDGDDEDSEEAAEWEEGNKSKKRGGSKKK